LLGGVESAKHDGLGFSGVENNFLDSFEWALENDVAGRTHLYCNIKFLTNGVESDILGFYSESFGVCNHLNVAWLAVWVARK